MVLFILLYNANLWMKQSNDGYGGALSFRIKSQKVITFTNYQVLHFSPDN